LEERRLAPAVSLLWLLGTVLFLLGSVVMVLTR